MSRNGRREGSIVRGGEDAASPVLVSGGGSRREKWLEGRMRPRALELSILIAAN